MMQICIEFQGDNVCCYEITGDVKRVVFEMAQQDSEVFNGTFLNLPAVKEVGFYEPMPKKVAKEVVSGRPRANHQH